MTDKTGFDVGASDFNLAFGFGARPIPKEIGAWEVRYVKNKGKTYSDTEPDGYKFENVDKGDRTAYSCKQDNHDKW